MLQHPVDEAKGLGFLSRHEIVPLAGGGDGLNALTAVFGQNPVHPLLDGLQALHVDSHIGDLALGAGGGLVNHNLGIGQGHPLALGARAQQERAHGGRHADADGRYITLDVLHGVVNRHTGCDAAGSPG